MRRLRLSSSLAVILLSLATNPALAKDAAFLAEKAVRAFICATYAEKANMAAEERRLLTVGYEAGAAFLEQVEREPAAQDALGEGVPTPFAQHLQGPGADFILGRVYESTREDTIVRLTFEDSIGRSLYFGDKASLEARAAEQYRTSFCELFR